MCEALFSLAVAFLTILGLIEVGKIILMTFFSRQGLNEEFILLVPICGRKEAIEMTLRGAISNAKWFGGKGQPLRVICLDLGVDAETRKICKIFTEEYGFIELHSLQTFNQAMAQSAVTME